jgi:hypothetical protein
LTATSSKKKLGGRRRRRKRRTVMKWTWVEEGPWETTDEGVEVVEEEDMGEEGVWIVMRKKELQRCLGFSCQSGWRD